MSSPGARRGRIRSRRKGKPTKPSSRPSGNPTSSDRRNEKTATTTTEHVVHSTAARGFNDGDLYERGRPDYPLQALEALAVRTATLVADLGCGTGKFTRLLELAGASVVGIEPLPAMVTTFRERCPDVPLVTGVAEAIPIRDETFDLVVCASAFHWFRHDAALPEIRRVLRPGGRLGIVWNRRDSITGWAADFWRITEAYRGATPGYRTGAWREAIERSGLFGPIEESHFDHVQRVDVDGLLARVGSISFIEILPPSKRAQIHAEARRFIESHPDTRGRDVLELPYRTAVYVTRPVGSSTLPGHA